MAFFSRGHKGKPWRPLMSGMFFLMIWPLFSPVDLSGADFGLQLGLSRTKLEYTQEYEEAKSRAGFQAGIFYNLELNRLFSIQAECNYNSKGNRVVDDIVFRIDYLEFPLLMKFAVAKGRRIEAGIFGGIYGAFRLQAKLVGVAGGDQRSDIKSFDYGLIAGISVRGKLKTVDLILDTRYGCGLENIVKLPSAGESIKNRGVAVSFGIGFKKLFDR
jgi:hypothetical protein